MLLLGEKDQPGGHGYVKDYFAQLAQPKEILMLTGSDHYLNTAQSFGYIFYDKRVAHELTNELVSWLLAIRPM
jgi:hypothetical protein